MTSKLMFAAGAAVFGCIAAYAIFTLFATVRAVLTTTGV